jgi:hypothetical protein
VYPVRLFGLRQQQERACAAEAQGDYAQAAALFAEAGLLDEAARVTILRGDAERRPNARMRHYARAATLAAEGSELQTRALVKRALALLALATDGPPTAAARRDLVRAAHELESLGECELAADAYGRAGDTAAQLQALERAGSVDAVEALLAQENERDRAERARRRDSDEFAFLLASGRRRDAVALARAGADAALRARADEIAGRRITGCEAVVSVGGERRRLLLGEQLVVGRSPDTAQPAPDDPNAPAAGRAAQLAIGSASLSRNHLLVFRRGEDIVVRDLGSRHGTELRGVALGGDVTVGAGLELRLGRAVAVTLAPATEMAGAVAVTLGASRYVAPLGPALLGVGRWRIDRGHDDWIELVTDDDPPAFSGALRWASRATLLAGDAVAAAREGEPVVTVGA